MLDYFDLAPRPHNGDNRLKSILDPEFAHTAYIMSLSTFLIVSKLATPSSGF